VAVWSPDGVQHFTLASEDGAVLSQVKTLAVPTTQAISDIGTLAPGVLSFGLELNPSRTAANATLSFGQDAAKFNRVYLYRESEGGGTAWESLMLRDSLGATIFANRIEFALADEQRGDLDAQPQRILTSVGLASVQRPWQNEVPEDVNNDGSVSPLDALILINQINAIGPRTLGTFPSGTDSIPTFLDPSGSNSIEPQDVLIVINYLNQRTNTEGEAGSQREQFVSLPPQNLNARGLRDQSPTLKRRTFTASIDSTEDFSRQIVPRTKGRSIDTTQLLRRLNADAVDQLFTELQDATLLRGPSLSQLASAPQSVEG
jgi:hypothetical protein